MATVKSFTEQTRKNETLKSLNDKHDFLQSLTRNLESVGTSCQRTMRYGDIWAKRMSETTFEIDNTLTRQEEFVLRAENFLRESLAVYFALHAYDGAITAQTYNKIVEEFEENMSKTYEALNIKGFVFTFFSNGEFQGTKMFDDPVRMKLWFNKHFKCDPEIFMNQLTVPTPYQGSILAEQDWCVNPEEFFSRIKNQS